MRTITVDDRRSVVNIMLRNLKTILPDGIHEGYTHPDEVLAAFNGNSYDVAFVDIEMPEMNGLELVKKLMEKDPEINIIFITGYDEYMPDAFRIYASAYLLKPISEAALKDALSHLRYHKKEERVSVQCFGTFEVFVDGVPLAFRRKKSKELFAYLVDRRGAVCSNDMIIGNLWGDKKLTESLKSLERTIIAEMIRDFDNAGIDDAVIKYRDGISVNRKAISCDYYDYLENKESACGFNGEYMSQYEFAEETRNNLLKKYY